MKNYVKKVIMCAMIMALCISMSGCSKEKEEVKEPVWIEEFNTDSEDAYERIACFNSRDDNYIFWNKKEKEYDEYDYHIGAALVYQLERYKDDVERKYHVIMSYSTSNEEITKELIQGINDEYDLELNVDDWGVRYDNLSYIYYYLLTAEEILILADNEIWCRYVGSGIGDKKEVTLDTREGIYIYCELYGDQYIQYK